VYHLGAGSDRNRGDEAVDQSPDGFAACAAGAVQRRCGVVVGGRGVQHRRPCEQAAKLGKVMLVTCAREDLHRDRIADGEVVGEEEIDGFARR
jgi:hypothetical protein